MGLGDLVVYMRDPALYAGPMRVVGVEKNGLLSCEARDGERYTFEAQELDNAADYYSTPDYAPVG